jgi:hypothetical protein
MRDLKARIFVPASSALRRLHATSRQADVIEIRPDIGYVSIEIFLMAKRYLASSFTPKR